eukprot:5014206-Prymnesium_polylepis.1
MNGAKKKVGKWTCLNPGKDAPPPAFVERLRDGDSLLGHRVRGPATQPLDYALLYPTALPAQTVPAACIRFQHVLSMRLWRWCSGSR